MKTFATMIAVALLASGAAAQTVDNSPTTPGQELPQDRGYDKQTPKRDAIDAQEAPTTQALNEEAAAVAAPSVAIDAAAAAEYQADLTAYERAVTRSAAEQTVYDARRRAYADAMAAWRLQVAACKAGKRAVCEQPAPHPDQFM